MINLTEKNGAVLFTVRVVPRASKSEIVGEFDGALKIKIASPPVAGAANSELVKLLSETFDVSRSDVEIAGGATAKTKQIKIYGATREDFSKLFQKHFSGEECDTEN